jgi:putative cardiolipin synthase
MLGLLREGLMDFRRINRRMHNKTWIADNCLAIAGGRNIGDESYGASNEVNFVDLDFAMIGPVVRDAAASFDNFWNSPTNAPMEQLDPAGVNAAAFARLREFLGSHAREAEKGRYAAALSADNAIQRLVRGDWPMEWSATSAFVSDDPRKVTMKKRDAQRTRVGTALLPLIQSVQTDLTIISPYFVPGKDGTALLVAAARAGKRVRVLTNSLIANDVAAVHGGYSRYRRALLKGGVQLWELKPLAGSTVHTSLFGSSGASLHTKALTIDGRMLFVGSYNLDPRSTWLNCEQGVLVDNAVLAKQLEDLFTTQASGQRAWQVTLKQGKLRWSDGRETFDRDPKATAVRRLLAWLTRVLPLDTQL